MARRQRSERFSPRIQQLRWDGATNSILALGAGAIAQVFITAGNDTETLMRIRGDLVCTLDGLLAPGALVSVGVGLIVMPAGQGSTVVSNPLTDVNAPWLMYEAFTMGYEEAVVDAVQYTALSSWRKSIDVKAQRILRPDREVQLVVANATINASAAVQVSFASRVLFGAH